MNLTEEGLEMLARWLEGRPGEVLALALVFPPGCYVRAKPNVRHMVIPQQGSMGTVRGYFGPDRNAPRGWLGLACTDGMFPGVRGLALPSEVELVSYSAIAPADVRAALSRLGTAALSLA